MKYMPFTLTVVLHARQHVCEVSVYLPKSPAEPAILSVAYALRGDSSLQTVEKGDTRKIEVFSVHDLCEGAIEKLREHLYGD